MRLIFGAILGITLGSSCTHTEYGTSRSVINSRIDGDVIVLQRKIEKYKVEVTSVMMEPDHRGPAMVYDTDYDHYALQFRTGKCKRVPRHVYESAPKVLSERAPQAGIIQTAPPLTRVVRVTSSQIDVLVGGRYWTFNGRVYQGNRSAGWRFGGTPINVQEPRAWGKRVVIGDDWQELSDGSRARIEHGVLVRDSPPLEGRSVRHQQLLHDVPTSNTIEWLSGSRILVGEGWAYNYGSEVLIEIPRGPYDIAVLTAGYVLRTNGKEGADVLWSLDFAQSDNPLELKPTVPDVGDIVSATRSEVFALDRGQKVIWRFRPPGQWAVTSYERCGK